MPNKNLTVQLGATSNCRVPKRTAAHTSTGTYLSVILDHHAPDMPNSSQFTVGFPMKAEAVLTDYCAGMNYDSLTDNHTRIQHGTRVYR